MPPYGDASVRLASDWSPKKEGPRGFQLLAALFKQLQCYDSRAQCWQRGRPAVPVRRYRGSMLLPSVQDVLLWCTFLSAGLLECHG